jgi:hypothetical protein
MTIYDKNGQPYEADLVPASELAAHKAALEKCCEALEEAANHIRSVCGTDDRPDSDSACIVANAQSQLSSARSLIKKP